MEAKAGHVLERRLAGFMSGRPARDVTLFLEAIRRGKTNADKELLPLVYNELRALARRAFAQERPGHTLQPTALVHEAYIRLMGGAKVQWESRAHFFRTAAQAMRRILIDSARRKATEKHGGGKAAPMIEVEAIAGNSRPDDLLALDECLQRLESIDRRMAEVVKLRYFAGLSVEDTASALGITSRTVRRDWTAAKAWLFREVTGGGRPAQ